MLTKKQITRFLGSLLFLLAAQPAQATNYTTAVGCQQFSITIAAGSATGTATINAVGSGAFMLSGGMNPSINGNPARDYAGLTLTNATTITATRTTGTTGTVFMPGTICDGDTSTLIKSVQYTTVTIANAAATGTASISAVTDGNTAVHLLGWRSANTTLSAPSEYPALSLSGTTLTAARPGTTGQLVVYAEVIEFQSTALQQNVQRLSCTSASNFFTTAFTSVVLNNSIAVYAGANVPVNTNLNDVKLKGNFADATHWQVAISGSEAVNTKTYNVSIVEFPASFLNSSTQSVQSNLTGVASATSTLGTSVNTAYSAITWFGATFAAANTNATQAESAAALTNSNTVTTTKTTATNNTSLSWEVFEFPAFVPPGGANTCCYPAQPFFGGWP